MYAGLTRTECFTLAFWHNKMQSDNLKVDFVDRTLFIRKLLLTNDDGELLKVCPAIEPQKVAEIQMSLFAKDEAEFACELMLAALPEAAFASIAEVFQKMSRPERLSELQRKVCCFFFGILEFWFS